MVVKTAISLPEDLFSELEARAAQLGLSRSRLLADALRDYLFRLETEELRRGLDAAYPPDAKTDDDDAAWMSWALDATARRLSEDDGGYDARS